MFLDMTHLNQFLHGEKEKSVILDEVLVENILKILHIDYKEAHVEHYRAGEYLSRTLEVDARAGGFVFAKRVLEELKDNKYIKGKYKKYVDEQEKQYILSIETKTKAGESYMKDYENLQKIFIEKESTIDFLRICVDRLKEKSKQINFALYKMFQMRFTHIDDKDIANDLVESLVLDEGASVHSVTSAMLAVITSKDFPEGRRKNVQEGIILLMQKRPEASCLYKRNFLMNFFDDGQMERLYKGALHKDISLANQGIFLEYLNSGKKARKFADILLYELKHDLIKVDEEDQRNALGRHVRMLCSRGSLSEDTLSELEEYINGSTPVEVKKVRAA